MAAQSPVPAEQLLKRYLGKSARKHWQSLLADIRAVACGLKPCFLYDYSSTEPLALSGLVAALRPSDPSLRNDNLIVLGLGQDTFLADLYTLRAWVGEVRQSLLGGADPIAVDVSGQLPQPRLVGDAAAQKLGEHAADILRQLEGVDVGEETCRPTVRELRPQPDWNISSIFGLLLGYPVVYWYADVRDASNCLSMVPLRVHEVRLRADSPSSPGNLRHQIGADSSKLSSGGHPIYSFSVPDSLLPHFRGHIESWFGDLQERTPFRLEMRSHSVTLPAVAL